MKPIFVFNPEHDLALANGDRHYIPPRNIREMAHDLAPLMEEALACSVVGEGVSDADVAPLPWGWDFAVNERFRRMGIPAALLPSDAALTALCRRSERATAHHLLSAFRSEHPDEAYVGESVMLSSADDIAPYAERYGHILLKAPLSGSGKGLRHVGFNENDNEDEDCRPDEKLASSLKKVESWASALIQRHGYLTAEPFYTKVTDFAMEFCVSNEACHFIGYSLFITDHHGRYIESRLLSDEAIEGVLTQYVTSVSLHAVRHWIMTHWDAIVPTEWNTALHPLYFGIDMMIVEGDAGYQLHPCIEVNLRLNMGIIAHELYRHRLAPEARGLYRLSFFPDSTVLRAFSAEQASAHPATFLDGKLVRGYLPLTPINDDTRHHAYILCE